MKTGWQDTTLALAQHLFGNIHLVCTYLMTNSSTPLPLVRICTHLEQLPFCVRDFIDLVLFFSHFDFAGLP